MLTTSVDPFSNNSTYHRRIDSDNDSAISLSLDYAEIEKRRFSVVEHGTSSAETDRRWSWKSYFIEPVIFFLPSFIGRRVRGLPAKAERHTGVAALDGLRGLACLIVLNARLTANYDDSYLSAPVPGDSYRTPMQLPVVSLFWSSPTMINIFFIISGYVLSYKPLRHIHSGNISDAHKHLTSSTIRRGLRLYLPTLFAISITGMLSWIGLFDQARNTFENQQNVYQLSEASPPRFVHISEQMKDTARHARRLFDIWYQPDENLHAGDYDLYTWGIPVEFRNSMTLLLSLFAVSRLRTNFRLITTLTFITFAVFTHNRSVVLFLSGLLLADIDQLRFARTRYISYSSYYHETSSKILAVLSTRSPVFPILFLCGLVICSIPLRGAEHDQIFKYLYDIILPSFPERAEWARVPGSLLIVWAAANSTYLQPLFVNRCAKYLGKISLALYLVHGSILKIVLHPILPIFYHRLGDGTKTGQTRQQMVIAWVFGMAMCLPISIWVADIFWRAIDLPCTRFARWLEHHVSEMDEVGRSSPKQWD